jgi:hypothetical protein
MAQDRKCPGGRGDDGAEGFLPGKSQTLGVEENRHQIVIGAELP